MMQTAGNNTNLIARAVARFRGFATEERGAVTVDYIAIMYASMTLGLAVKGAVDDGVRDLAERTNNALQDVEIQTSFDTSSSSSDDDSSGGDSGSDVSDVSDTSEDEGDSNDDSADSSDDSGSGNPGNDKDVGSAGESPSDEVDMGGGSKGASDGSSKSKSSSSKSKSSSSKSKKSSSKSKSGTKKASLGTGFGAYVVAGIDDDRLARWHEQKLAEALAKLNAAIG